MRYNYITVEAQRGGSLGTGPTGSSLPPSFELLSAKAVTLRNRGGRLAVTARQVFIST